MLPSNQIIEYLGLNADTTVEQVFFKIHLKRKQNILPLFIVDFLQNLYLETSDVRYFNEMLWVIDGRYELIKKSITHFYSNLDGDIYKFCYENKFKQHLKPIKKNILINHDYFKNKKIALIGNPIHFILAFFKFKKYDVNVDVINLKYHPQKIKKIIFFNLFTDLIYKFIFGKHYSSIKINNKNELIKIKLKNKYDVGFHKLSFIIKENILDSFKLGLINDHWGLLPFLKGKSTLFYSKLFGMNLTITNHLVSKKIDSGKILCYSEINESNITKSIYFNLADRIFISTNLLCGNKFLNVNNLEGYVFYEIHPWLKKIING